MNRLTAQKWCFSVLFLLTLGLAASAQDNKPADKNKTTTDENFTLNITESRVTETNYERSTEVEIGASNDSAVEVRAGATVRAKNIVITLRGITGNVRFRASLEKIRRLLE